jgi:hypothetical protein
MKSMGPYYSIKLTSHKACEGLRYFVVPGQNIDNMPIERNAVPQTTGP